VDTSQVNLQAYKRQQVRLLPDVAGVYALCDLDGVPIYVGQAALTADASIRKRIQRHITSARSDIIANRQLDVWEVAFVQAWPVAEVTARKELEAQLFHFFERESQLVNGSVPRLSGLQLTEVPTGERVQVLPDDVLQVRRDPAIRFPRQSQQFNQLLDYILNTQDKQHLRRALQVHHARLTHQLRNFLTTHAPPEAENEE